ncbi:MAG TPA: sulfatase-like hydrolase/transferase [Polyangia bacterium]|nr:sulfatase-like hydrolase/transferase [Polyangia bacterium]
MRNGLRRSALVARLGSVPLIWLALAATGPLGGCARDSSRGDVETTGTIGLTLAANPGVTLNAVTYTITGNGFNKSGTIDTSGAPTINGSIGGIPAGKGYTITLTAKSADGSTTFTGSATFDVTAGATTSVTIHLNGSSKTGNGSVVVNGTINLNPRLDEVTVTPQTVFVGASVSLSAAASDPDAGPSPLSYYWSTTGGVIDNPIAPSATLTSAKPGTFTITVTVSDGAGTDSATTTVSFVRPSGAGGAAGASVDGGGAGTGGSGGAVAGGPSKPNILLIIADDLGAEASALYPALAGTQGQVPIPNIQALANNGLVFNNAWASPVCSPTRGTIVSGQYGFRTGVTTVGNVLPTSTVTLFDRLNADTPYTHAFFGKYHLGGGSIDVRPPTVEADASAILQHVRDLGIKTYRGILGGALSDYFSWWTFDINGPQLANTTYSTTALTDYAIDFIHQQAANPSQPWFVYQAFNAPHAANGGNNPFQVPPPELHHVDLSSVGNPAPGAYQTSIPVYQAEIQALDTELGRLLAEVDFSKTLVIFIGDNGVPPPVKDTATGLRDAKGSAYEGGVRVPLIFAGAGVTRRGREDSLVEAADLYATILDVAGVAGVSHVNDSFSVKPLLTDEAASSGRTFSFSEISSGTSQRQYGLRDTRFKLVNNLGKWELYDLVADPHEATNLYLNPAYAAARDALLADVAGLRAGAAPGYFQSP